MRRLLVPAAIAFSLVLTGCPAGDDPGQDEPPEFDLDDKTDTELIAAMLAEAECEAGWTCPEANHHVVESLQDDGIGRFESLEACIGYRTQRRLDEPRHADRTAAIDDGRLEIDRQHTADCRQALVDELCSADYDGDVDIETCANDTEFVSGTLDDGDHCNLDAECGPDLECHDPPYDSCYGTCGSPDADESQLAGDQFECGDTGCDRNTEYCREEHAGGGQMSYRCESADSEGAECWDSRQCEGDLACIDEECQPGSAEGLDCMNQESCKDDDLVCSSIAGSECAPAAEEGDECNRSQDCETDLLCIDNTCSTPLTAGEECNRFDDCADELRCVDETCQPPGDVGDDCESRSDCRADLFCAPHGQCTEITVRQEGQDCSVTFDDRDCEAEDLFRCHNGEFCEAGTRCLDDADESATTLDGHCRPVGVAGDSCLIDSHCADGHYCDGDTCRTHRELGDACDNSDQCGDAFCHRHDDICTAPLEDGKACNHGEQCQGYCDMPPMNAQTGLSSPGTWLGMGTCESLSRHTRCRLPD